MEKSGQGCIRVFVGNLKGILIIFLPFTLITSFLNDIEVEHRTGVMIFALLLAGTFAWNDFNQHKTDMFSGSGDIISVTLNDLYYPPENWTMNNATVNKEVSVSNLDISTGPAFVRLSIKEYLEAIEMDPDIFIEDNGEKVLFATWATGPNKGKYMTSEEAQSEGLTEYGQWPVDVIQEDGTTQTVYYATTNTEELKNGIYGKPMMEPGTYKRWGTQMKANISHELQKSDECDYEPYLWDDEGILEMNDPVDYIRQYIELNIGTQDVDYMFLEDWYTNENKLGPYWIIDIEDGWVYWGEPLYPGNTTIDFIRDVTLLGEPGYTLAFVTTPLPTTAVPSPTATLTGLALTIAITPVVGTFTADGILWKVLNRDGSGNVLIISNYVLDYPEIWHASTSANGYVQSNLRTVINNKYAGFTQLKQFAKVPSFNINIGPNSTYSNDKTTCTANFAGGNTTDIMFALGYGDAINAGFGFYADADRIANDVTATGTARGWWLRTPGSSALYASSVYTTGILNTDGGGTNTTRGVRPALFVNSNP